MSVNRTAPTVARAALALGLLGDHLFRAPVWGLNLALWSVVLVGYLLTLTGRPHEEAGPAVRPSPWVWVATLFFVAMWLVRDAPLLLAFDLLAVLALFCVALLQVEGVALPSGGAVALLTAPVRGAVHLAIGGLRLASVWRPLSAAPPVARHATAIGIGVLLAIPPVVVFGGLFTSADPVFGATVSWLTRVDLGPLVSHLCLTGALTWAGAGYLWAVARPVTPAQWPRLKIGVGIMPVLIALGATALVFTLFVGTQVGSLFGGEAFVRAQTGLTYADYARQGFFQMVFASALAVPMVYVARFVAGPTGEAGARSLRVILTAQLALTGLVLASALWRMGLYVRVYGLTEDRLYGTAVMVWIAATLVVFGLTVLRGQHARGAFGSLVAGFVTLAILNMANPQALIARYNLAHQERRPADVAHLVQLGGDAVPVLVAGLDRLAPAVRCRLVTDLIDRHAAPAGDWRGWNLARARARRAVKTLGDVALMCAMTVSAELPSLQPVTFLTTARATNLKRSGHDNLPSIVRTTPLVK